MVPNYVFSIFSFIGFILSVIPFPWHFRARSAGTCAFMFWTASSCLILFINSIIWNGNAVNIAPVWCDITTKWLIGGAIAIPATSLSINRRVYLMASAGLGQLEYSEDLGIVIDLFIGLAIPVLRMATHYIVQGHRFNIYENFGCYPVTWVTTVSTILMDVPLVVVGCISAVYCVLSIKTIWKARCIVKSKARVGGQANMDPSRFYRLMAMAGLDMLCSLPLSIFGMHENISMGPRPWIGWVDTHMKWNRVDQLPAIILMTDPANINAVEKFRWLFVACAFAFFAFFGFAEEARRSYWAVVRCVVRAVGMQVSVGSGWSEKTTGLASSSYISRSIPSSSISETSSV